MMFMNEYEIDEARERWADHPVLGPATTTLTNLRDAVNANSDGWPYWKRPLQAATKLMTLINGDGTSKYVYGSRTDATAEALKAALTPLKRFQTTSGIAFDIVDADDYWKEVGRQAFREGKPGAPALNQQVMDAVGNNKVGDPETIRIMKAFGRGWTAEMLAAPVDDRPSADEEPYTQADDAARSVHEHLSEPDFEFTPVLVWADGTVSTGMKALQDYLQARSYGHHIDEPVEIFATREHKGSVNLIQAKIEPIASEVDDDDYINEEYGIFPLTESDDEDPGPWSIIRLRIDGRV